MKIVCVIFKKKKKMKIPETIKMCKSINEIYRKY